MKIKKMNECDIPIVAKLHKKNLESPSSKIGEMYLRKLYEILLLDKSSISLVAFENNEIVGAITATLDLQKTSKNLKKSLTLTVLIITIYSILFRKVGMSELLQRLRFESKILKKFSKSYPTILTLFVSRNHQRKGIGSKLTKTMIEEFKKRNTKEIYLDTLKTNEQAIGFYERLGFKRINEIEDSIVLRLNL